MNNVEGTDPASANSCFAFSIRRQTYLDSVALMRISRSVCELEGVEDAALMMATPANIAIMLNANLIGAEDRSQLDDVGASDLLLAVRAGADALCKEALSHAEELLDRPLSNASSSSSEEQEFRPTTLRLAHEQFPDASLALISVPGEYAAAEARKALIRGLNVMLFSDNVPLSYELELKQFAVSRGLIVMGPDCGTAHIAGVPLAFANQVKSGAIGLVGASGTGLQEVMCLLDAQSLGISHAIGVGGRDLSDRIGGLSTLQALEWLDNDAATQRIVVISKPPAARALDALIERMNNTDKPVTACLIGLPVNDRQALAGRLASNVRLVYTLEDAAGVPAAGVPAAGDPAAGAAAKAEVNDGESTVVSSSGAGKIRGLFCGGTLCAEAQVVLQESGCDVMSNAPVPGATEIKADVENPMHSDKAQHVLLDLGADEFTAGKPHPMIEPQLRSDWIEQAMAMSDTSVLLLDCVLGFGSHQDPAGVIVEALNRVQSASNGSDNNKYPTAIIASVTGTEQDFQNKSRQIEKLQNVGVVVCRSNAEAARQALQAQLKTL